MEAFEIGARSSSFDRPWNFTSLGIREFCCRGSG